MNVRRPFSSSLGMLLAAGIAHGQDNVDFSIDAASSEVPGTFVESDLIEGPGTFVLANWLQPGDELDALSDGYDFVGIGWGRDDNLNGIADGIDAQPINNRGAIQFFYYSVTRDTLGTGVVEQESTGNGAAGDKFVLWFVTGDYDGNGTIDTPPPFGAGVFLYPFLSSDAPQHNLTPLPGESEIDALDVGGSSLHRSFDLNGWYYSLAPGSPTLALLGAGPGDILYTSRLTGVTSVWATAASLGLVPGDDIDALAVSNSHGGPPSNGGIWFSLRRASPSLATLGRSAGDVIAAGSLDPVLPAGLFGLLPEDDLDGLTITDPLVDLDKTATIVPYNATVTPNRDILSANPAVIGQTWNVTLVRSPVTGAGSFTVVVRTNRIPLPNGVQAPPPLPVGAGGRLLISGTKLGSVVGIHNGTTGSAAGMAVPLQINLVCMHFAAQATVIGGGVKLSSALEGTVGTTY